MSAPANPPGGEDGHKIKCVYCDGFGVHQNLSRFDPCPDECRWCSGNGYQEVAAKLAIDYLREPPTAADTFDARENLHKVLNECTIPSDEELEHAKAAIARLDATAADTGGLVERAKRYAADCDECMMAQRNHELTEMPADYWEAMSTDWRRVAASAQQLAAAREQIAELERDKQKLEVVIRKQWKTRDRLEASLSSAHETIRAMREALGQIKWRSADKDNMEFSATITCWQMDAIRAALTLAKEMPDGK